MQMQIINGLRLKLLAVLALAGVLRFWGLGAKQLWVDEIIQLIHSTPHSLSEILAGAAQDRGSAPLDYLIQHFFAANLGGAIQWTARFHAALFGILAVLLIYLLCQELFGNQPLSLMCALLFCFYPFHHHYSQEGRPYSLFVLLTLCLYLLLLRSLKKNTGTIWGCFTAVAVLTFYSHAYASLVLFGQFLFLIYHQILQRENWQTVLRRGVCFLFSCSLAFAAYLPWLFVSFPNARGDALPGIDFRLFLQMIKELADGSYPLAIVLIFFAAAGIRRLIQTRRLLELGALLIWLLSPIPVILFILTWREYFFAARQLIFITPAIIVLATVGIDGIKQKVARRYFYPELILILMSFVIIALHYPDKRDDFQAAGQFLKKSVRAADVIVSPNVTGLLSLYLPNIYDYSGNYDSIRDVADARKVSRIIYVDSRFNHDRAELDSLLSSLPEPEKVQFRGITIYVFLRDFKRADIGF